MNSYHKGKDFMKEVMNNRDARGSDLTQGALEMSLWGIGWDLEVREKGKVVGPAQGQVWYKFREVKQGQLHGQVTCLVA